MKIEKVETESCEAGLLSQLFVSITTDEGIVGRGEAWWGLSIRPVESAINDLLAPLVTGEDSSRIERLWQKMYRHAYRYGTEGAVLCGLSGIDLALWDLMGKRLGVRVAELSGGVVRERLKAYASLPPLRRPERLREEIRRAIEAGFAGVKLHEVEVEMVRVARDVAPEGYPIMLDVNGHWTPLEAEQNARRLEELDLVWLEEPVWPMQDHEAMARVRQRVDVRFAAGENEYQLSGFDALMRSGAVDYVQPEITKIGGLSVARRVSALADLHNLPICPHGFRIGPALYANIHWALSQVNMEWLEVPWLPADVGFPAAVPMPELTDGQLQLPEGPGLGVPWVRAAKGR